MLDGQAIPPPRPGLLEGYTRLSKFLAGVLVMGYLVSLVAPSTQSYLALVPGKTLPQVWNLFTAGIFEVHLVLLIVDVITLLIIARSVEPIYGSKEFLKYFCIVNVAAGITALVSGYVSFFITRSGVRLYTEISGFHGIIGGLLVAVKHVMPEHELRLLNVIGFRASVLPGIYCLAAVLTSIFLDPIVVLPFALGGTYFGWLYLRFWQPRMEGGMKGDPSDDFKFSSFFPTFLQLPVDMLAAACAAAFCSRREADSRPKVYSMPSATLPGTDAADAARRRERGAKALEERLSLGSSARAPSEAAGGGGGGNGVLGDEAPADIESSSTPELPVSTSST